MLVKLIMSVVIALCCGVAAGQAVDDIHADMQKGNYRGALQKIGRRLPESRANPAVRYELLMLRGESLVQLKQKSSALDAYRSALAAVDRDGEIDQTLAARAMVELLTASAGWIYKTADGATFDLIATDSRKQAAAALLAERVATLRPKADRAANADALGPMIELMPAVAGAMSLEHHATGAMTQVGELVHTLGDRARFLLNREVQRIAMRTLELEDLSNDFIMLEDGRIPGRRGLHSDELAELKQSLITLDTILQTSEEGRRINRRLGGDGQKWDEVLVEASEAESRVRGVISINEPQRGRQY